ncbi:hypothetical protein Avbf_07286 [Armadillidium vulgare]|nr:hypothetical protein Avbf_07286 [Armadillidium vulgare]
MRLCGKKNKASSRRRGRSEEQCSLRGRPEEQCSLRGKQRAVFTKGKTRGAVKICSDHFTPDCINPGVEFGKPTLKQNAIPTIFNFSTSSKLKKRKEQEYFETESKVKYHLRNRFRSKTTFKI